MPISPQNTSLLIEKNGLICQFSKMNLMFADFSKNILYPDVKFKECTSG